MIRPHIPTPPVPSPPATMRRTRHHPPGAMCWLGRARSLFQQGQAELDRRPGGQGPVEHSHPAPASAVQKRKPGSLRRCSGPHRVAPAAPVRFLAPCSRVLPASAQLQADAEHDVDIRAAPTLSAPRQSRNGPDPPGWASVSSSTAKGLPPWRPGFAGSSPRSPTHPKRLHRELATARAARLRHTSS